MVNLDKFYIFFSANTPRDLRRQILNILGLKNLGGQDKFLGLLSNFSRSKSQSFKEMKHKIQAKFAGWKEKLLSQGGKEVLIKAITTAIPVFAMSCFRLLVTLCKEINSMVASFWCRQKE